MTSINDPASDSIDRNPGATALPHTPSIFPLPLVPFERYMIADDRPGYPMTFPIVASVEGVPDREAMDAAFAEALRRNPLLVAHLARIRSRDCWIAADSMPPLNWVNIPAAPDIQVGKRIDLRRSVGIDGTVWVHQDSATIDFTFHHAVCDGIGAIRFLGDVLACYGRMTDPSGVLPTLPSVLPANLAYRGIFDIQTPVKVTPIDVAKSVIREGWKVAVRRPVELQNKNVPKESATGSMRVATLSADVYDGLCASAQAQQVTLNDLMLRDMFLAIDQWNRNMGSSRGNGWLRVIMPTSLRGKRDARMPATNVLGYALVTRSVTECSDTRELLAGIAAESQFIRTWSMGALFPEAIRMLDRIPFALPLAARFSGRLGTIVLSNVGDITRRFRSRFLRRNDRIQSGNLTLQRVCGVPPIRRGTRASFAMLTCAGQIAVCLNADPKWFSNADADRLLRVYCERLEASAGETPQR